MGVRNLRSFVITSKSQGEGDEWLDIGYTGTQSSRGGEGGSDGGSGTRSQGSSGSPLSTASSLKTRILKTESVAKMEFQCLSLRSLVI